MMVGADADSVVPAPRHLTISGDLGSGKSTVARIISGALGMEILSTGDIHRTIARELNTTALGANYVAEADPSIDERIDSTTVRVAREAAAPLIFDSRMAWHFVENALRVRLLVDPGVAARRVLSRATDVESYESEAHAAAGLVERSDSEIRRFRDTYGVDISDLRNYQLVIDTSDASPQEVADAIVTMLGEAAPASPQLRLSPARVVSPTGAGHAGGDLVVEYERPVFVAVAGTDRLAEAVRTGRHLEPAQLAGS